MRGSQKYAIPVKGLKTGTHQYSFDIDKKFFESFDYSEINDAAIKIIVELDVEVRTLSVAIQFDGYISVLCNRCLEYFHLPLNFSEKVYVEKGEQHEEEKEEMIIIPENEHEIELTQYLYESIVLHMPYQLVHPNDEQGNSMCNQEMLDKLNEFSADEPGQKESDPRWHVLKDLKN